MAAVLYAVIFAACARAAIEMSQRKPKHGRLGAVYNCGNKNLPLRCLYYIVRPPHANVEDRPPYEHRSGLKNPTTLT